MLDQLRKDIRKSILTAIVSSQSGHLGASFSIVELLIGCWKHSGRMEKNIKPNQSFPKIILSKGHGVSAYYSLLCRYSDEYNLEDFHKSFRKLDSCYQGHNEINYMTETFCNSGSLGIGVGMSIGYALALKKKKSSEKIYCLLGDGEYMEGLAQEALSYANENNLKNIIFVIDNNGYSMSQKTPEIEISGKNLHIQRINGNSMKEVDQAFKLLKNDKVNIIIGHTIKSCGIKKFENNLYYHSRYPPKSELKYWLNKIYI